MNAFFDYRTVDECPARIRGDSVLLCPAKVISAITAVDSRIAHLPSVLPVLYWKSALRSLLRVELQQCGAAGGSSEDD